MSEVNPNSRLEFLSDGVFAIAITLLIIEIKVPPLASMHTIDDVWHALIHLWPSFLALFLSFIIIFISWFGHHTLFSAIDKTSDQFVFANGFFLLTLVIIPFPTAFVAEYLNTPYAQPAIVFFSFCSMLHNIAWRLIIYTAEKPKLLIKSTVQSKKIDRAAESNRIGTYVSGGLFVLSWWLPYFAFIISLALSIFWIFVSVRVKKGSNS